MFNFKNIIPVLFFIFAVIIFNGCKDDSSTEPEVVAYKMGSASYVEITLDNMSGDYSANVTWYPSRDENEADFTGYAVATYEVNENGVRNNAIAPLDSATVLKPAKSLSYNLLEKNKYYKTSVYSISFNNTFSAPAESEIYNTFEIAPPANATIELCNQAYAWLRWTHSTDVNKEKFQGYKIATYRVTPDGQKLFRADTAWLNKLVTVTSIIWIEPGKYYKTYIWANLENGAVSRPIETHIYGVAVPKENAEINPLSGDSSASSAYGWNYKGESSGYVYSAVAGDSMDMVCTKNGDNYYLYSPSALSSPIPGARITKFDKLDAENWSNSYIRAEPDKDYVSITKDDVILLKNSDGYYIKLKIMDITTSDSGLATIKFNSKFQNLKGLRVI